MKGKFVIEIPLKGFSKHDDPQEVARILKDTIDQMLQSWENYAGFIPLDQGKTKVAFVPEQNTSRG